MKNEVMRIKAEEADINYLQRIHYEVMSRNEIVTTLIENHAVDESDAVLNSPAFKTYSNQLSELKAELELAKLRIAEKYLPEKYKTNSRATWEADFSTGELVIRE